MAMKVMPSILSVTPQAQSPDYSTQIYRGIGENTKLECTRACFQVQNPANPGGECERFVQARQRFNVIEADTFISWKIWLYDN